MNILQCKCESSKRHPKNITSSDPTCRNTRKQRGAYSVESSNSLKFEAINLTRML